MKEEGGKFIDNYEILETIRDSAEGIIYRAVEKSSDTKVLIKRYYPSLDWSDEVLNEFFNLSGYLRFIEHEYLLSILDIGKDAGKPYVVFADNSVNLLCDRQIGQADQKETVNFLYHTAEVLDFLHKQEILHGSLSPENIALDADGYPLLFDFGLSGVFKKLLTENMDDGFENLSIASLKCTSPEQVLGRTPTRVSDIYTFGIIGYYYIFGKFPFEAQHIPEIALLHFTDDIIQTIALPENLSVGIIQFIQKCIQVNPDARFANFTGILSVLEEMKSDKKPRLHFEKRFAITKRPVPKNTLFRFSPAFVSAVVLAVSLLFFYYLYTLKVEVPVAPPIIITATSSEQPATLTQKPTIEKPTESSVQSASLASTPVNIGYKLAFEGEQPYAPSKTISIDNLNNLHEISRLGYGKPEQADVAPDDNHIAVASSAGVFIFNGNQFLKWIDPQGWATSVQFSPDGNTLAIGLITGEIQLWDWQAGVKSATLTGHTKKINRILFSKGGRLYSASADQHIRVWDLKSNASIQDISAHALPVNDIAITSDGRTIASCADDQLIRVWDAATGNKLYELDSKAGYFSGSIKAVAISSDDRYLAAGGDAGLLYQWRFVTTSLPANSKLIPRSDTAPMKKRIWSLEYTPDDKQLLIGMDDGESTLSDATLQTLKGKGADYLFTIPKHDKNLLDAFGADFDFASFSILLGSNTLSINWDGSVTVASPQTQQIVNAMFDNLNRLDFSRDGKTLAAGGKRGSTHVWNLTTNQSLYKNLYFMPFGDPLAPDGSAIALIVPGKNADIYQIKNLTGSQTTLDLSQTLPNAHVGYTKDGTVFIASNLQVSKGWDFPSGTEAHVKAIDHMGCRISVPDNNPKEKLLVNSALDIFLPGDDEHIDNLCPKTFQYKGVPAGFSQDLSLIAYINSNGALEGYDVLKQIPRWGKPYQLKKPTTVTVITVSPDGSIVALGDTSGTITFINGNTGELINDIVGNFGKVQAINFSEDDTKIATAGSDGVVRVFGIVEIK